MSMRRKGRRPIDITGEKFGKLEALYIDEDYPREQGFTNTCTYWVCKCDCGNLHTTQGAALRRGTVKSCGRCTSATVANVNQCDKCYSYKAVKAHADTLHFTAHRVELDMECDHCGHQWRQTLLAGTREDLDVDPESVPDRDTLVDALADMLGED